MSIQEAEQLKRELQEKEKAMASIMVEYMALKKDESRASKGR